MAEATRVAIQAMAAAATEKPQSMTGPKICRQVKKQPNFNWEAGYNYNEIMSLKTSRLEVNNIFASYNTPCTEQLAIVKKLVRQESQAHTEKEKCNTIEGLFKTLNNKFKPQFNEKIMSLQFCKLSRQNRGKEKGNHT